MRVNRLFFPGECIVETNAIIISSKSQKRTRRTELDRSTAHGAVIRLFNRKKEENRDTFRVLRSRPLRE